MTASLMKISSATEYQGETAVRLVRPCLTWICHRVHPKFCIRNRIMDQKNLEERREPSERRASVVDRRLGLDRRRGPGRRRSDDRKSAEDGNMSDEQFEFLMAIDEYKRVNNRPFPTWTEVLEVIKALGYRRVAEPSFETPPNTEIQTGMPSA